MACYLFVAELIEHPCFLPCLIELPTNNRVRVD